jgi:hypothetical protein
MQRSSHLVVEENNFGTMKRVLNCEGGYHADRPDRRQFRGLALLLSRFIQRRAIAVHRNP